MLLPRCPSRVTTDVADLHFCRHERVHARCHLVNSAVCQSCPERETESLHPRPVPSPEELADLLAEYVEQSSGGSAMPGLLQSAGGLVRSLADFAADGFHVVSEEVYEARLSVCDSCPQKRGSRCLKCGCNLALKAKGRAFQCPLGKWPEIGD